MKENTDIGRVNLTHSSDNYTLPMSVFSFIKEISTSRDSKLIVFFKNVSSILHIKYSSCSSKYFLRSVEKSFLLPCSPILTKVKLSGNKQSGVLYPTNSTRCLEPQYF